MRGMTLHYRKQLANAMQFFNCGFSSTGYIVCVEPNLEKGLSRRERQIMDILYRLGQASAQEVMEHISDPPSYSAIRALLATLEQKGWIVMQGKDSRRYIFKPAVAEKKAKRSALSNLLHTFFEGKPERLVASLLDPNEQHLSQDEIARIRALIDSEAPPER
jgi:predicted transcriptional regulator